MRIWDLHPGYLDRKRLLGEHRELHGLFNILHFGRKGYARHPETLRWVGCLQALRQRHSLLVAEMALRGYRHQSPLPVDGAPGHTRWPATFINTPAEQLALLAEKQRDSVGPSARPRIPLPGNAQQLWAQHKYSVMAADPGLYRSLGPEVAHGRYAKDMAELADILCRALRRPAQSGRRRNMLLHLWGYLEDAGRPPEDETRMLHEIQRRAKQEDIIYLLHSTALAGVIESNPLA